jgi:hypothetical protein
MVCPADFVQLVDLLNDLLVQGKDIGRFDVCALVLFQEKETVSGKKEFLQDGLFLRADWRGRDRRVRHDGS